MIFLYYAVIFAVACFSLAVMWLGKNKQLKFNFNFTKIAVLAYGILFFVRMFGGPDRTWSYDICYTIGLNTGSNGVATPFGPQGQAVTFFAALLLWLIYTVQLLLVTYPFFEKHLPRLKPIVKFVTPAVYLISACAFPILAKAIDGDKANGFHWRLLIFAIEIGLGLAVSIHQSMNTKYERQTKKQWVVSALLLLGMFFMTMPCWAPQVIIGSGNPSIVLNDFNIYHRLILYGSVLFAVPVHFLFTRCEYEQRRYALIYISMATMISYCYKYTFHTFLNPADWPLHLCNTAMFIIPVVLIFRLKKVYYFTIFINVLGAFFAMIMPNLGDDVTWLSNRSMEFWLNHYMAFMLPILLMSLRIFNRPKMKEFVYSLIAFAFYYMIVLFANAYLTGVGENVDFFFINSDFVADKLGTWAIRLRDTTFTFSLGGVEMKIYPIYQPLYFTVYIILSFAMWFVYEQAFEITDVYGIIMERNRKIKADRLALEAHLAGRDMQEPMNPQNDGKLILRHFSKRYSTSDVFAVYDANLEIEGGQIFGFLGPNGAGKSTIIKSIVGIQTITSGEIEVSGYDVDKQAVGAKMQIGFVPDHYALYENLTGREYINYIADLYNVSKKDRDTRIAEYVARFRLESAIDNPMKTYSHGMKQKITIMSALVHNPKIWILDEPLTGLDPESIFQVKECMKEHAAKGNIVFFSTHIIDVVERICDRIAIIRKGQILCTRSVAEIEASGVALEDYYMNMIDGNTQPPVSVKDIAVKETAKV